MEGWLDRPDGVRWWWAAEGRADGPTVLLLPPGNRNASVWPSSWRDGLHAAGWHTLRVDLPGQGRSKLGDAGFDVDRLAGDVAVLLGEALLGANDATAHRSDGGRDAAARHRVHVVGAGLGGVVAMALAEVLPLASLTLLATSGWYVDPAMPGAEEPVMVSLLLRQERHTPELLRRALLREVRALAGPLDREQAGSWPDLVDDWLGHGQHAEDPHRRALLEAAPRWPALGSLGVPTMVVHGSDDPLVPLAHGERLAATIPGAGLHVVAGAGHHLGPALLDALASSLDDRRS